MSIKLILSLLALSGLAGIALGYVLRLLIALGQRGSLELEIKQQMLEAKEKASKILRDAEERAERVEEEHEKPLREREDTLKKAAERLGKREEFLDERERALVDEADDVRNRENEAANIKREAEKLRDERRLELVRLGRLSENEAKDALMKDLEESQSEALLARMQKLEAHGRAQLEDKARSILLSSIHRMAANVNSEVMTLSVAIPSEEIKGKVIGKEGRNIKAFE
ncbi:MAG: phosphodiesterase, uncharacterized protein, partial [Parcubacteria group bacterium]|nr:phosphodiesterase, uncharacterized protein [Parcubacteria group bacterium]